MEDGIRSDTGQGTPQGAICSPILANIFMHYVLDLWFRNWRSKVPRGEAHIIRYADDFVLEFQYKQDAYRCLNDLRHRFQYFGLSLHPDKTRTESRGRTSYWTHKTIRIRKKKNEIRQGHVLRVPLNLRLQSSSIDEGNNKKYEIQGVDGTTLASNLASISGFNPHQMKAQCTI